MTFSVLSFQQFSHAFFKDMRPLPSDKALSEQEFNALRTSYLNGHVRSYPSEPSLANRVFSTLLFLKKIEELFCFNDRRSYEILPEQDLADHFIGEFLSLEVLPILVEFKQRYRMQKILRWVDECTTETQIRGIASVLVGILDELRQITTIPPGLPDCSVAELITDMAQATELPAYHTAVTVETIHRTLPPEKLREFFKTFRFPDVRSVDGFTIHEMHYLRKQALEFSELSAQHNSDQVLFFFIDLFNFYIKNR